MQQSKIDSVVNQMIDRIRRKERGFVLDLASHHSDAALAQLEDLINSETVPSSEAVEDIKRIVEDLRSGAPSTAIEVRESLPPVDEYVRPSNFRGHRIGDTASFIAFAERYGDKDKSLVMFNDDLVVLAIDELVERGERELITCAFDTSEDYRDWDGIIGQPMAHKGLYKFLLLHGHNLESPELLESVRTMKANVQVKHESDIQETEKTIGFLVKAEKGEDLKKFPKNLAIRLPVLESDVTDDDAYATANLMLEIDLPDQPTQPVAFTLHCPKWKVLRRERVRQEADLIAEALSDFTVVRGVHNTLPRKIGR